MIEQIEHQQRANWLKESVIVKLAIIAALILLLLIPSAWIQNLITEREGTRQQVMDDVSNNWSGSQLIQGPVLVVPYQRPIKELDSNKKEVSRQMNETLYLLPQNLDIKASVLTEVLHRGIFDAVVFNTRVLINGTVAKPDLAKQGIDPAWVQYDKVRLCFSVSDLKGLKSNPELQLNGQKLIAEPALGTESPFEKGLQVSFSLAKDAELHFNFNLDLKGSDGLSFLHTGKTTSVEVSSTWPSPKFDGRYLPDTRTITNNGFTAKWRMLYYNRPFPQQWINDINMLSGKKADDAIFGVRFHPPVDQYQKTMRTTKYSSLVILLTFVSLFFAELIKKQRIHVFNYILIGAAMVIYYTLLLSFSEQLGYNLAYLVASVATIILIAVFTASLLKNNRVALLFGLILSTFYGVIFILIQMEQLSLIIGSVLLFIIIALLMYFSRKITWEKH